MATKVTAPGIGAELDTSDPKGSLKSVGLGIVGTGLSIGIFMIAKNFYNEFVAEPTGDTFSKIEVV